MLINKNDKFSIRKFKNGRSDSVKIGAIGVIVGTAIALSAGANSAEAAVKDNTDGTTTISNKKATTNVETANVSEYDFQDGSLATKTDEELAKIPDVSATRSRETDPSSSGTNEITKTGKVDYKYVTTDNTVLEENKNQDSGANKTLSTDYDVYGKSGEVFKGTTGGDAEDSDLNDAKENGKKKLSKKMGKLTT